MNYQVIASGAGVGGHEWLDGWVDHMGSKWSYFKWSGDDIKKLEAVGLLSFSISLLILILWLEKLVEFDFSLFCSLVLLYFLFKS